MRCSVADLASMKSTYLTAAESRVRSRSRTLEDQLLVEARRELEDEVATKLAKTGGDRGPWVIRFCTTYVG